MHFHTTRSCQDLQELVQPTSVAHICIHHFHTPCPCNLIQALETSVFNHLHSGHHHIGQILTLMNASTSETEFRLCVRTGNISVCNGCRNKFDKKAKPPYDLCVQHEEWHHMCPLQQTCPSQDLEMHNPACIISKWPYFCPQSLVVSSDVQSKLNV